MEPTDLLASKRVASMAFGPPLLVAVAVVFDAVAVTARKPSLLGLWQWCDDEDAAEAEEEEVEEVFFPDE